MFFRFLAQFSLLNPWVWLELEKVFLNIFEGKHQVNLIPSKQKTLSQLVDVHKSQYQAKKKAGVTL